jgi:hypothetical protein
MALRSIPAATFTDEQWLEHLQTLCKELQIALEQAANQRLHLQELKRLADAMCGEAEAKTRAPTEEALSCEIRAPNCSATRVAIPQDRRQRRASAMQVP